MNARRMMRVAVLAVALPVLAACASGSGGSGVGEPAQISHIHGLGVAADGTLHVATHTGLIRRDGNTWIYASEDRNDHMGFSLHPGDGVMYRSGHSVEKPSLGVQRSTDGARWQHLADVANPPVDFHAMAVSFADSRTLWGWDSGGRGGFRSTDGGTTWTRLEPGGIEGQVYVLAGPAAPNVVLAGTASGLHRSEDGGITWVRLGGLGEGWVIGVAADPNDPNRILTSAQEGIRRTTDGGDTWLDAGRGLPTDAQIAYLAISPLDGNVAYAADASRIYQSNDGGGSWTPLA